MAITNLIGTKWVFNETPSTSNATYDLYFTSNGEHHTSLILNFWGQPVIGYSEQATAYVNGEWKNENYKTIEITGGLDGDNADLIVWLIENATQIINLTNTTWTLKEDLDFSAVENATYTFNVNLTSNGEEFNQLSTQWMGGDHYGLTLINSNTGNRVSLKEYTGLTYDFNTYRTITITGGDDVENANLIAWLETNNMAPPEFTEVKVPLKIYTDLTVEEYEVLKKDEDSFYLVDDVGIYKGDKLIAKNSNVPTGFTYTFKGEELEFDTSLGADGEPSETGWFYINSAKAFNNKMVKHIYFAEIKTNEGYSITTPILTYTITEVEVMNTKLVIHANETGISISNKDEIAGLTSDFISEFIIYVVAVF